MIEKSQEESDDEDEKEDVKPIKAAVAEEKKKVVGGILIKIGCNNVFSISDVLSRNLLITMLRHDFYELVSSSLFDEISYKLMVILALEMKYSRLAFY